MCSRKDRKCNKSYYQFTKLWRRYVKTAQNTSSGNVTKATTNPEKISELPPDTNIKSSLMKTELNNHFIFLDFKTYQLTKMLKENSTYKCSIQF